MIGSVQRMTIFVIMLLLLCGASDSCTQIGQVCYKCRGNVFICNDGSYSETTAEGCISYVMSNPEKLSAHYKPSNTRCFPYMCTNNMYFSDSKRFTIRKTCNTDCSNFTLSRHTDSEVTNAVHATSTTSLGQCFENCFDTVGCYAFSYNSDSVCSIYTSCGTSCSMVYQSGTTVYTRTCHTETDCGQLNNPLNGAVNFSTGTTYNKQAIYTCSTGYMLDGTSNRTCQANGQWSGFAPKCNATDCGKLKSPSNGVVDTASGTTYNYIATYACFIDYTLIGTSNRTCQADGQWSGFEPVCNATDCGKLISPSDGTVDATSGTTYNNEATYTCSTGYTLIGTTNRTCQADGQWSDIEPECHLIDCKTLKSPPNGTVNTTTGTTYNKQAIYTCSTGYTLIGTTNRTCQADGQWSDIEPECRLIDCKTLKSPPNGTVNTTTGTTYNKQAIYKCSTGYTLVGISTRTCQENGQWSGLEPECNATNCGTLPSPQNGTVDMSSGATFNIQVTYECFSGFILVGSSTRTCKVNGNWSGSQPDCIAECGAVVAPPDGDVDTFNGTTYSNQAVYTCSTGYMIVGNSYRICQSNGQWSGSEPSCTIVDCGSLSPPDNGYIQNPENTTYLEQATFTCFAGYNLTGNYQTTCQSDGSWSGIPPTCTPVDCGLPSPPNNGAVVATNGTTFGQNAKFYCRTGYKLNGIVVTTCNANGIWDSSASCNLTDTSISETVRLYIAPCTCYSNKTFTGLSQEEVIDYLVKEMRIQRNSTALARSKLTSAKDSRVSSQIVGYIGVLVIAGTLTFAFVFDAYNLYKRWNERRRAESIV